MPSAPSRPVVLYARPGCHLCEDAAVLLDEMLGPDGYVTIDIDTDDQLLLRYAHRIPVVAIDGTDALELIITRPDLEAAFSR
jgi:hypothetical protein